MTYDNIKQFTPVNSKKYIQVQSHRSSEWEPWSYKLLGWAVLEYDADNETHQLILPCVYDEQGIQVVGRNRMWRFLDEEDLFLTEKQTATHLKFNKKALEEKENKLI